MQSKISFFNFTVFKKTCLRFFPIWGAYLFIMMMIHPMTYLNYYNVKFAAFSIAETIPQGSTIITFIFGCASALAVLSYTYNLRSTVMFHSLPVSREAMFTTNYIAGLSFMLIPNLLIYGMTALVLLSKGADMSQVMMALTTWLGATSAMGVFFYSFAIFLGLLTGSWFMLPILYTILNFTVVVLESIIRAALEVLLYGYSMGELTLSFMSPVVHMMSEFRFTKYNIGQRELVTSREVYIYLIAIAIVGIILAVASLLLYRKRNMEMAGEIISIPKIRPIFKYCFATGCSVVIGAILYSILGYYDSMLVMYISIIIGGVLGYLIAAMAMKKSFRLNKRSMKGLAIFVVVLSLAFSVLAFDLFGLEEYVPEEESIYTATIEVGGYKISANDGDISLEDLLAIHRQVIDQKDEDTALLQTYFEGTTEGVNFEYQTKFGTVKRYYRIPVTKNNLNSPESAQAMLESVLNSEAYIAKRHFWAYSGTLPYMVDIEYYGKYYKPAPEELESTEQLISGALVETVNTEEYIVIPGPDDRIEPLVEALKKDIKAGVYSNFGEIDAYEDFLGQVRFYYMEDPKKGGYMEYLKGYEESEVIRHMYTVDIFEGSELAKLTKQYMEEEYINYIKNKLSQ